MKQDASPGSMHDAGCLGLVHWDDPEGWYGEGGGRRILIIKEKKKVNKTKIYESLIQWFLTKGDSTHPRGHLSISGDSFD